VITLEVTQNMRDDVVLHNWKMMIINRYRVTWGLIANFQFPNGISFKVSYGQRPFHICADAEWTRDVETLLKDIKYTKKIKKGEVEFSVRFENKGEYLDVLWELCSIGRASEI
jgi:hypothetical protein